MTSVNIAELVGLLKALVGFNSFITPIEKGIEVKEGESLKVEFLEDGERHRLIGILNDIEIQAEALRLFLLYDKYEEDDKDEEE